MTTYSFTHNGETRDLNPGEIKRWTGLAFDAKHLKVILEWIDANKGSQKYPMLAFTTYGVMCASSYRMNDGKSRTKAAARNNVFNKPTGGVRLKTGERA